MFRVLFLKSLKHDVNRILELLVILPDLHGVDEFDQGGEVLFLDRCFIMDISDQCAVEQRFSFRPEFITGFSVPFGVGNQRGDELKDVLLAMDIGERIVVHALPEVDRIQDPDLVSVALQGFPAFEDDRTFRVGYHIGRMHLEKVWLQPEPRLTGTGSADDQNVLVPCIRRVLGAAAHHQAFRRCQYYVVFELRIYERLDVRMVPPTGRAVLLIVFIMLRVLSPEVDCKTQPTSADRSHQQVQRVKARERVPERHPDRTEETQHLFAHINPFCQPPGLAQVRTDEAQ